MDASPGTQRRSLGPGRLIYAFEENTGLEIPDEDAEKIRLSAGWSTPGKAAS